VQGGIDIRKRRDGMYPKEWAHAKKGRQRLGRTSRKRATGDCRESKMDAWCKGRGGGKGRLSRREKRHLNYKVASENLAGSSSKKILSRGEKKNDGDLTLEKRSRIDSTDWIAKERGEPTSKEGISYPQEGPL